MSNVRRNQHTPNTTAPTATCIHHATADATISSPRHTSAYFFERCTVRPSNPTLNSLDVESSCDDEPSSDERESAIGGAEIWDRNEGMNVGAERERQQTKERAMNRARKIKDSTGVLTLRRHREAPTLYGATKKYRGTSPRVLLRLSV